MPSLRYILTACLLGGVCLLVAGCPGGARKRAHPASADRSDVKPQTNDAAKINYKHYKFVFPDQGPPAWVAQIDSGEGDNKTGVYNFHTVDLTMYKQGQVVLKAKSDEGKAVVEGKVAHITLFKHVVATEPQHGVQLKAETFHWVSNKDTFDATQIHTRGLGYEQWADNGTVTTNLSKATLSGNVRIETSDVTPPKK